MPMNNVSLVIFHFIHSCLFRCFPVTRSQTAALRSLGNPTVTDRIFQATVRLEWNPEIQRQFIILPRPFRAIERRQSVDARVLRPRQRTRRRARSVSPSSQRTIIAPENLQAVIAGLRSELGKPLTYYFARNFICIFKFMNFFVGLASNQNDSDLDSDSDSSQQRTLQQCRVFPHM